MRSGYTIPKKLDTRIYQLRKAVCDAYAYSRDQEMQCYPTALQNWIFYITNKIESLDKAKRTYWCEILNSAALHRQVRNALYFAKECIAHLHDLKSKIENADSVIHLIETVSMDSEPSSTVSPAAEPTLFDRLIVQLETAAQVNPLPAVSQEPFRFALMPAVVSPLAPGAIVQGSWSEVSSYHPALMSPRY